MIEKRSSGFLLVFAGTIGRAEMTCWLMDSEKQSAGSHGTFGVIVDARKLELLNGEAQALLVEGQALYKKQGMLRSAVAVGSPAVTRQLKRLAEQSGIGEFERFVDTRKYANWAEVAVAWVRDGIHPDALLAFPSYTFQPGSHWMQLSCRIHRVRPCDLGFRIGTFPHSGCAGRRSWRRRRGIYQMVFFRVLGPRAQHYRASPSWHCPCSTKTR